ncbi:MAG: hypothetical protein ABWY25_09080 [Paenisporosarcina sp.]
MSAASISRAANDEQLRARVLAMAHKEMVFNEALANTKFGQELQQGMGALSTLMWPVAVDTEAAYETALLAGRGAPGFDTDIITDAAITSSIVAHWPEDPEPVTP